jgi:hypothetical protein
MTPPTIVLLIDSTSGMSLLLQNSRSVNNTPEFMNFRCDLPVHENLDSKQTSMILHNVMQTSVTVVK